MITSPDIPANVRTSQTPLLYSYNLNSYDNRTRAWAAVFTQEYRTVMLLVDRLDFLDLPSSNLLHESSVDL